MPNKRALIVDDSTTAQYRLKQMLRAYGLDIDTADSGEAALRYLATSIPDVIFMDHLMPGMDGFRALQIIKSHPETAKTPVIMYTSKSGEAYTVQARALGAVDVVSKDTLTAAELAKVMNHNNFYRVDKPAISDAEKPVNQKIVDSAVTSPAAVAIESTTFTSQHTQRRAQNNANTEQARNLELRLSHMEHTLEDSRRFITARVLREIQNLKHNIKQEFHELLEQGKTTPHEVAAPPVQPRKILLITSVFLVLGLFAVLVSTLYRIDETLNQTYALQNQLNDRLAVLIAQSSAPSVAVSIPIESPKPITENDSSSVTSVDNAYLADLAWTFNQSGMLPFNQINIDSKTPIRLYELLNRLITKGFKGRVLVNVYIGNFCLVVDKFGQGQLPDSSVSTNDCVFSSDIYGLDKIKDQYEHEVESVLAGLNQKDILIIINTLSESEGYPDHKTNFNAKSWNMVAQNHNRIELRLEVAQEPAK